MGAQGRIVERDIRAAAARSGQAVPAILTTEADATELMTLRPRLKVEDAPAPAYHHLIAKLAVVALADYPQLNAAGTEAVHLSLAVDTGDGLGESGHPRRAYQELGRTRSRSPLLSTSGAAARLGAGGRAGRHPFAIANLGMYGIDAFTPDPSVPPHRATLGLGRIAERAGRARGPRGCHGR